MRHFGSLHAIVVLLALTATAQAKTITLDASASDAMAMISADAPRMSWAGHELAAGMFVPTQLHLNPTRSLLIRFNLDEIPAGMRVVRAEWIIPAEAVLPEEVRVYVWRMSAEWGAGVSHENRMIKDGKPVAWAVPGGKGSGADRSARPVAILRAASAGLPVGRTAKARATNLQPVVEGELKVNVTEDVSLWVSGAAPNYGWMVSVEDMGSQAKLPSPVGRSRDQWRLRITYEPE